MAGEVACVGGKPRIPEVPVRDDDGVERLVRARGGADAPAVPLRRDLDDLLLEAHVGGQSEVLVEGEQVVAHLVPTREEGVARRHREAVEAGGVPRGDQVQRLVVPVPVAAGLRGPLEADDVVARIDQRAHGFEAGCARADHRDPRHPATASSCSQLAVPNHSSYSAGVQPRAPTSSAQTSGWLSVHRTSAARATSSPGARASRSGEGLDDRPLVRVEVVLDPLPEPRRLAVERGGLADHREQGSGALLDHARVAGVQAQLARRRRARRAPPGTSGARRRGRDRRRRAGAGARARAAARSWSRTRGRPSSARRQPRARWRPSWSPRTPAR